jgi:hypothetical protein
LLRRALCGHRGVARSHHFVQCAALVRCVAFHGLDQIRHEVVALAQLHVDIGIGLIDPLPH